MKDLKDRLEEAETTLDWIIKRIEEEADKAHFERKRPNYKKAATECVEEAYRALSILRIK